MCQTATVIIIFVTIRIVIFITTILISRAMIHRHIPIAALDIARIEVE